MFEALDGPEVGDLCVPGVPRPAVPAGPPAELTQLREADDAVLAMDLSALPAAVLLAHARGMLAESQRVHAATLAAISELDRRELYALDGAGSARGWLAQQPTGRPGLAAEADRLSRRPLLRAAVAAGDIAAATADTVASALDRLPDTVEEDQLLGVLRYGVPALLADRGVDPGVLGALADEALGAVGLDPAQRLEPACVLLVRHLPPTTLAHELRMLLDALLPEELAEQTRQAWLAQALHIRTLRGLGAEIRIRVDDALAQLTEDALMARLPDDATARAILAALDDGTGLSDLLAGPIAAHRTRKRRTDADADAADAVFDGDGDDSPDAGAPGAVVAGATADPSRRRRADAADAADADPDPFGTVGPGRRLEPAPAFTDPPVEGTPRLNLSQKLVAAFATLLADLTAVRPGSGTPQPVGLTVVTTLDALNGLPGALPAQLDTRRGSTPLSLEAVHRLGCGAVLTAVVLDAAGSPVGASGEHRHATPRERRALRARWGSRCAVNGCTHAGATPHHVEPWWKTHRTRLDDLAPICEHHHHDVHDGHRTLRLRDGRLIDDQGWADQLPLAV